MKYRPEVDGLRTIAVLAVLFYHAEIFIAHEQLFKGGYLGVDIFFVISGYLITSLIATEYQATGRFSYRNFYERRLRRLQPALITVMVFSMPLAWMVLLPTQLIDFSKSLLSSLFFASNFYWHGVLQEYGAESALIKPFLHTWSLAVEEQFYLVFPLLLVAIYRYLRRHVMLFLSAALVASLAYSEFVNAADRSFAFYMLPTRFWELLFGALIAIRMIEQPLRAQNLTLQRLAPAAGLTLISCAIIFIEFSDGHPGLITVIPVLGAGLIIRYAGKGNPVTRLLASKLFVSIGLMSYSLYLWHYPIFAFGRIIESTPGVYDKLLWFFLSFLLSFLTFKFIETPFRSRTKTSFRSLVSTLVPTTCAILFFAGYTIDNGGLKERFPELIKVYAQNEFDNSILKEKSKQVLKDLSVRSGAADSNVYARQHLWFSDRKETTKILIAGNSHSKDLFNAFYLNRDLFRGFEFARYFIQIDTTEADFDAFLSAPNFRHADIILISTRYLQGGKRNDLSALPGFLERLKSTGKRIYVASNSVEFEHSNSTTIFDRVVRESHGGFTEDQVNTAYFKQREKRVVRVNSEIREITSRMGVRYLDKSAFICDLEQETCSGVTDDGFKVFYDYGHFTLEGARFFGQRIFELGWLQSP